MGPESWRVGARDSDVGIIAQRPGKRDGPGSVVGEHSSVRAGWRFGGVLGMNLCQEQSGL